jgi:hypothetical protein
VVRQEIPRTDRTEVEEREAVTPKLEHSDTIQWEMVGVVTLEDVIEELIHEEIEDEHDVERDHKDAHAKKAKFLFSKEESKYAMS